MTIAELKQRMIKEFKKETGLDEFTPVEVKHKDRVLKGRIKYFKVDEDTDEVKARVVYSDEIDGYELGRPWFITKTMLNDGTVRIIDEDSIDECIHYWERKEFTGRYKKVLTLGGWDEREVYVYRCKFCGKEITK